MSQPYNSLGIPVVSNLGGGGGGGGVAISGGANSQSSGTVNFANSNGITFGLSNNGTMTASYNSTQFAGTGTSATNASITLNSNGLAISVAAPGGGAAVNFSAGTTSNNLQTVVFSNSNGVSFGLNGSTITGSHNALTTARASTDAIGLNTAQSNVTWTVNSSGLSLDARGYAGTGTSATNASITLNSNGLAISVAAAGGGGAVNFSAGTTSNNLQSVVFANANGITFGLNTGGSSQSITASHNGLTTARASTDAIGLNTAQTNVTWTVNSSGLSLNAAGYAGTTTAITGNASITLNSAGLQFNGSGLAGTSTGFTGANISGSMTHNSSGLALSLSVAAGGGGGDTVTASRFVNFFNYANSTLAYNWNGSGTQGTLRAFEFDLPQYIAANMFSLPASLSFGTAGTSSASRTVNIFAGIYFQASGANTSVLSQLVTQSFSIGQTYNNSSITINQPTSTNSTGYTTGSTTSAGLNITSQYTGLKALVFPIGAQTLTPGRYVLLLNNFASTAGGTNLGLSGTFLGLSHTGNILLAPIGSLSSAFTSGTAMTRWIGGNARGMIDGASYTASSNAFPATLAMSGFAGLNAAGVIPLAIFSSE